MMIWPAISWYCAGPTLNGQITASDCIDILSNRVHATVQMLFSANDAVFQEGAVRLFSDVVAVFTINDKVKECIDRRKLR